MLRTLSRVAAGLVLAFAVADVAAGQQTMRNYQLVLLKPGPAHHSGQSAEGQQIIKDHVAFIYSLGADGHSMAAGPFVDKAEIGGLIIMAAESPEKAREVVSRDPAIKAGIYTIDVLPFMALDAGMRPWAEFPQLETVYFGFLNSGPNRGHDAETSKRLQAEHMAYMKEQHTKGRLVFAGPFVDGGIHRGLVVYRAASMEEAKTWAEGDPAVKIGRLAVDLHAWQVPKGALPDGRN